ncbi:MAG: energy transducer TonB [Proteiniphilum sp.]|nr:energy transducer TonB [Proteiniphilum sp.]
MEINKLFGIIFMIFSFISCQTKKENSNVILTDFTKELISTYINDVENLNAKNSKDEIIIISVADSLHYYLSVFANNSKEYKFCREDFVRQTSYLGHLIRVFGNENSNFYSVINEIKIQKRCSDNFTEYDPSVWRICFYKDLSFCKMRTYKVIADEDISAIQSLAEKHFGISNVPVENNDIYKVTEVEIAPRFTLGEDSLRHLIYSNFAVKSNNVQGNIPVVVRILIDKNGKATLNGISKSSNDTEIDNEALRVAKIICQYEFISALHRGEKVNAFYPVVFLKSDIEP